MDICLGVDIGTTSVSCVAVDAEGRCLAARTQEHAADVVGLPPGFAEQDPARLASVARSLVAQFEAEFGPAEEIGWTGQMHGVVGVDDGLRPMTNLVTWRDGRRFGGRVMSDWQARGIRPFKCVPVASLVRPAAEIDRTFLHSWYLDEPGLSFPHAWLPEVVEGRMIGDNQAGVFAAQRLMPGCAVVNLGTSGQLSVVRDEPFRGPDVPGGTTPGAARRELRPYPGGRTLDCRVSLLGGAAWDRLRRELGLGWTEMNESRDPRVLACAERIAADLFRDVDLAGVTALAGGGNALVRNPALRRAVEACAGRPCRVLPCPEMAAYGAALMVCERRKSK